MGKLAVLIDADNIGASSAAGILAHVATLGTASIRRIYGKPGALAAWAEIAGREFFELRPQGHVTTAKNGTDIALAIDAMDMLHERHVHAFCIVSNDRDFIPLATRLRASGKAVHAVCRSGSITMAGAFDTVLELTPADPPIVSAFRKIAGERGELSLGEAGKLLREHLPGTIPTSGKAPLRKALVATNRFAFSGSGSAIRVRLIS